jgi:hypothetical protein
MSLAMSHKDTQGISSGLGLAAKHLLTSSLMCDKFGKGGDKFGKGV